MKSEMLQNITPSPLYAGRRYLPVLGLQKELFQSIGGQLLMFVLKILLVAQAGKIIRLYITAQYKSDGKCTP